MSLIETTVSVLLVGILFAAVLNTLGASSMTQSIHARRETAMLLAQDLMSEILQQAYEDPNLPEGSFGLGADEVGDGSRALWEDVDDYNGWSASPPESRTGAAIAWAVGYERAVMCVWLDPNDLATPSATDTGVKGIWVFVRQNGKQLAKLAAIRTRAWQDPTGQ